MRRWFYCIDCHSTWSKRTGRYHGESKPVCIECEAVNTIELEGAPADALNSCYFAYAAGQKVVGVE